MIEWTAGDAQEILGYLFGSFCLGWCCGKIVSVWNNLWKNF